jgi:hypothetical protein
VFVPVLAACSTNALAICEKILGPEILHKASNLIGPPHGSFVSGDPLDEIARPAFCLEVGLAHVLSDDAVDDLETLVEPIHHDFDRIQIVLQVRVCAHDCVPCSAESPGNHRVRAHRLRDNLIPTTGRLGNDCLYQSTIASVVILALLSFAAHSIIKSFL